MQVKKYEFIGEPKGGLRRIRRIRDGVMGGWIQDESNLSHEGRAWVANSAKVYGRAQVLGDAFIYENAQVYGDAAISGNACIFGRARVYDEARVSGSARIAELARVYGDAEVEGYAHINGRAWVSGFARVYSNMRIVGNARISDIIKCASRSDGYIFTLIPCADKIFRVSAGCRFFTMEQAWRHWGHGFRANSQLGLESEDILVMFEHHIQRVS